jgi:hypothetical protein
MTLTSKQQPRPVESDNPLLGTSAGAFLKLLEQPLECGSRHAEAAVPAGVSSKAGANRAISFPSAWRLPGPSPPTSTVYIIIEGLQSPKRAGPHCTARHRCRHWIPVIPSP